MDDYSTKVVPAIDTPTAMGFFPKILGYRLERVIAQGGCGRVYAGKDMDGREVAIKVPLDDTALCRDAFKDEMILGTQLNHPYWVKILDANSKHEPPFFVMPLYPRQLKELLSSGCLKWWRVAEIGSQLASALQQLHSKRGVHGDIKLENVLLDDRGQPVIIDLGVAIPADLNPPKFVGGTINNMPLEQKLGDGVDGRADVYGLGVVLWELATGEHPTAGQVTQGPPRIKRLREIRPEYPRGIARILETCLETEPTDRPSAVELRDALLSALCFRRYRIPALAALCIAVIVMLLVGGIAWVNSDNEHVHPLVQELLTGTPEAPPSALKPTIQFDVYARRKGQESFQQFADHAELASEVDEYVIAVKPKEEAYLYVMQVDSLGNVCWLFPSMPNALFSSGNNPVQASDVVVIPGNHKALVLDDNIGQERIIVAVSAAPWPELWDKLQTDQGPLVVSAKPGKDARMFKGVGGTVDISLRSGTRLPGVESMDGTFSDQVQEYRLQSKPAYLKAAESFIVLERIINHVPAESKQSELMQDRD